MSTFNRSPLKLRTNDRHHLWREKFKSQCAEKVKAARKEQIDQRRYDSWMNKVIEEEWQQFRRDHELELQQAGAEVFTDFEALIEESINASNVDSLSIEKAQYEEYERSQQDELSVAIDAFESSSIAIPSTLCFNCRQSYLFRRHKDDHGHCNSCRFTARKEALDFIEQTAKKHSENCNETVEYSLVSGEDENILAVCVTCDFWVLF